MIAVTLLVLAASIWLLWEWRSGALLPSQEANSVVGRRSGRGDERRVRMLPTSAALNADAEVAARVGPRI